MDDREVTNIADLKTALQDVANKDGSAQAKAALATLLKDIDEAKTDIEKFFADGNSILVKENLEIIHLGKDKKPLTEEELEKAFSPRPTNAAQESNAPAGAGTARTASKASNLNIIETSHYELVDEDDNKATLRISSSSVTTYKGVKEGEMYIETFLEGKKVGNDFIPTKYYTKNGEPLEIPSVLKDGYKGYIKDGKFDQAKLEDLNRDLNSGYTAPDTSRPEQTVTAPAGKNEGGFFKKNGGLVALIGGALLGGLMGGGIFEILIAAVLAMVAFKAFDLGGEIDHALAPKTTPGGTNKGSNAVGHSKQQGQGAGGQAQPETPPTEAEKKAAKETFINSTANAEFTRKAADKNLVDFSMPAVDGYAADTLKGTLVTKSFGKHMEITGIKLGGVEQALEKPVPVNDVIGANGMLDQSKLREALKAVAQDHNVSKLGVIEEKMTRGKAKTPAAAATGEDKAKEIVLGAGDTLKYTSQQSQPPGPPEENFRLSITRTDGKNETLDIATDATVRIKATGAGASVIIPETIGIDSSDAKPRIAFAGTNPVEMKGGSFIVARESTQIPIISGSKDDVAKAGPKLDADGNLEFRKVAAEGTTRPVTIERGAPSVSLKFEGGNIDLSNKTAEEAKKSIDALNSATGKKIGMIEVDPMQRAIAMANDPNYKPTLDSNALGFGKPSRATGQTLA